MIVAIFIIHLNMTEAFALFLLGHDDSRKMKTFSVLFLFEFFNLGFSSIGSRGRRRRRKRKKWVISNNLPIKAATATSQKICLFLCVFVRTFLLFNDHKRRYGRYAQKRNVYSKQSCLFIILSYQCSLSIY
jgi:hypothetical protein